MLFKITSNPIPPKPQVKDSEFKEFFPVINRSMDWSSIEPFIRQAEDREIIPAIGQAFYDVLETEYQANGTIADPTKAKTFRLLRTALAHYAMYYALPQLTLRVGDAGTNETNAGDVLPVRQWIFNTNRWETAKTAYQYLDMALEHMEGQVEDENGDYDTFKTSTAYTIAMERLIPNARVFQQFYNINTSRKAYNKLRPYIRKAEKISLAALLDDFYDELATQHTAGTLSTKNEAILPYVQQLLAELTIQLALPDLNWVNDGDGWRIMENIYGMQMPANLKESLQQLHTQAEQNAASFELQLKNYLYANLDDYPTYRDSDANELTQDDDEDGIADAELRDLLPPEAGAVII